MNSRLPSEVIVLAEDERHQKFARLYLKRLGFQPHAVRSMPLPAGKGCGEQWVREQYAEAVKNYRTRAARARSALVVIIDSDLNTVDKRVEQLRLELAQVKLDSRAVHEKIVHLIPKRNVETWVLYLTNSDVDELSDYKQTKDIDLRLQQAVLKFFELTRTDATLPGDCLPSLMKAIGETKRLE